MEIIDLDFLELSEVERGADGLPSAWPLFRVGDNRMTLNGRPINLRLAADDLRKIADYHKAKGAKIPIDCRHVISNLAGKIGVDEAEIVRRLPRIAGVAGFGALELRGDALYLSEVEFLPIAKDVMSAGMIRYYSPTLRGLDGQSPLRLTSVALTNEPQMQNIPSLAASEDDEPVTPEMVQAAQESLTQTKEAKMPEENKNPEESAADPKPPMQSAPADSELLAILKEVLGDGLTTENLKTTLAALKTKADELPELKQKVTALELAEQTRAAAAATAHLEATRQKWLDAGVLTPARLKLPYVEKMDAVELDAYCDSLKDAPVVPTGVLELGEPRPKQTQPAGLQSFNSVSEAIAAAPVKTMQK